jgi:ketosteroid isomerase-like protein
MNAYRILLPLMLLSSLAAALVAQETAAPALSPAAESLRGAELAFAASARERDAEAFATFLSPDVVFLGAATLKGPEAVLQAWAPFFVEGGPELEWEPELVEVLDSSEMGITRGPYVLRVTTPEGEVRESRGTFSSVWRREDGAWRVLFDSGCPPCDCAAAEAED